MLYMHIGSKVEDLLAINKAVMRKHSQAPIIDGDGWPEWGERPGTESNPIDVLHVIIPVRSADEAEELAEALPKTVPMSNGAAFILTDQHVWSTLISTRN